MWGLGKGVKGLSKEEKERPTDRGYSMVIARGKWAGRGRRR